MLGKKHRCASAAAYHGVMRMAPPMCCGFELGNAHSRAGSDHASAWVIVRGLNFRTCGSGESDSEKEVVPRKASGVQYENLIGHFAVRGRQSRAVGSHSSGSVSCANRGGFKDPRRKGPKGSEFPVVPGSPNESFKRTPNTPRPAANAFGIFSQHSAPRSVPFN